MRLFVVRHVKAGDRKSWTGGSDFDRPISAGGRRQADAIAARLASEGVTRLITSPIVRCRQSLEPLGEMVGLAVETDDRLVEGSSFADSLALVAELPSGAVLCSHGDVVPDLISALVRRGMELTNDPDWRKATLWTLEGPGVDGDGEVRFDRATVEPPPPSKAPGDLATSKKTSRRAATSAQKRPPKQKRKPQ